MTTIVSPTVTRESKINFVMMHRHGVGGTLMRKLAGVDFRPGGPKPYRPSAKTLAAEQALMSLSEDELDAEYVEARNEAVKQLMAKADREERDRPFNRPEAAADFSYWAKNPYWTIWEAVALLMGKNPKRVDWDFVKPYLQISPFAKEFERVAALAHRAAKADQLTDPVAPGAFIAWAERYEFEVPSALKAEVAKFGHYLGDWKTLYDGAVQQRDAALDRAKNLQRMLEEAGQQTAKIAPQMAELLTKMQQLQQSPTSKPADPREIDTLRKMLITMAVRGYSYKPADARSSTIAEIVDDAERLGLDISRDTVRKHLKAAADLLPPEAVADSDC